MRARAAPPHGQDVSSLVSLTPAQALILGVNHPTVAFTNRHFRMHLDKSTEDAVVSIRLAIDKLSMYFPMPSHDVASVDEWFDCRGGDLTNPWVTRMRLCRQRADAAAQQRVLEAARAAHGLYAQDCALRGLPVPSEPAPLGVPLVASMSATVVPDFNVLGHSWPPGDQELGRWWDRVWFRRTRYTTGACVSYCPAGVR